MKQFIRASLIFLVTVFSNPSFSFQSCEMTTDQIMTSYNEIVKSKNPEEPLQCLLALHKNGSGILKSMAASALRPILGGKALAGRILDFKVKRVSKRLQTLALQADDLIHDSFLSKVSEGTWGFYDLFCKTKDKQFCTLFLPDETQIHTESSLAGSSSLIVLRTAYLSLNGSDRKFVEQRLRNLYLTISKRDALKRKTIEQIYGELFGMELPAGRLS